MQAAYDVLGDRNLSSGIWPVNSPNTGPYDFFFRSCLKDKVYTSNTPKGGLRENIHREIANISALQLQRVN
jgi:hypothetical protein